MVRRDDRKRGDGECDLISPLARGCATVGGQKREGNTCSLFLRFACVLLHPVSAYRLSWCALGFHLPEQDPPSGNVTL